jgi:hypothetical protein
MESVHQPISADSPASAPALGCEKCSVKISDLAASCPHCGHPQPKALADQGHPNGVCTNCKTMNLLSFNRPPGNCRGCGLPLNQVCSEHFKGHALARAYDDAMQHYSLLANFAGWGVAILLTWPIVTHVVWNYGPMIWAGVAAVAGVLGWKVRNWILAWRLTKQGWRDYTTQFPECATKSPETLRAEGDPYSWQYRILRAEGEPLWWWGGADIVTGWRMLSKQHKERYRPQHPS